MSDIAAPPGGGVWLEDGDVRVHQLALGCITRDWRVGGRSVVLGYADPAAYADNPFYLGAVVGRVANRIGGAAFTLGGVHHGLVANEGDNMLHGGPGGLSTRIWQLEQDGPRGAVLRHVSRPGDQGFVGRLEVEVRLRLAGHALTWQMTATPDTPTPVSLAQHNYYDLGGDVRDVSLWLAARRCTPVDADGIPTGAVDPVAGATDFTHMRRIGAALDLNFALTGARLAARATGRRFALTLETDQPGVQVYTAQGLAAHHAPLPGQTHEPFGALCLEPQGWPDAVNQPGFPSIIATPDAPYRQTTTVTITPV